MQALLSSHDVDGIEHAPPLVQTPAATCGPDGLEQDAAAPHAAPVVTAHMPVPIAQAWQVGHVPVLQHTLFTQLPIRHSLPTLQTSPSAFFIVHEPGLPGLPVQK